MHSILYAFSQFDVRSYVVAPDDMTLLPEFTAELDERNVRYEVAESVEKCIADADVIYMEPVVQADYTKSRDERGGGVVTGRFRHQAASRFATGCVARKPTLRRFQPLVATIRSVSARLMTQAGRGRAGIVRLSPRPCGRISR